MISHPISRVFCCSFPLVGRLIGIASLFGVVALIPLRADETSDVSEVNSISWTSDLEKAVAENEKTDRPILILFSTPWCVACQQMKQTTLKDRELIRSVRRGCISLQVNGDERRDLIEKFQIERYPTLILWQPRQKTTRRWVGPQTTTALVRELDISREIGKDSLPSRSAPQVVVTRKIDLDDSPVGFQGICLVSLLDDQTSTPGSDEFAVMYRGQELRFSSAAKRDRFFENPERYWPAANGNCTVTSEQNGKTEIGDPHVAVVWKGKIWLFADRSCQKAFIESPDQFVSDSI